MSENKDCETCELEKCPEECFNRHPGSMIALRKLVKESGKDVHIVGDYHD
jgi:hypothetical protein